MKSEDKTGGVVWLVRKPAGRTWGAKAPPTPLTIHLSMPGSWCSSFSVAELAPALRIATKTVPSPRGCRICWLASLGKMGTALLTQRAVSRPWRAPGCCWLVRVNARSSDRGAGPGAVDILGSSVVVLRAEQSYGVVVWRLGGSLASEENLAARRCCKQVL